VRAIGVYGGDPFGRVLVQILSDLGADTTGMLDLGPDWQTLVYAKPYVGREEQSRLDFGTRDALPEKSLVSFEQALAAAAAWADVVVINQQVDELFCRRGKLWPGSRRDRRPPRYRLCGRRPDVDHPYLGAILKLNVAETVSRSGRRRTGSPCRTTRSSTWPAVWPPRPGKPSSSPGANAA